MSEGLRWRSCLREPTTAGRRRSCMSRLGRLLFVVLVFAACGSSGRVSTGPSTSTTVPVTSRPDLRGVPVRKFECTPRPVPQVARPTRIAMPRALLLCPLDRPDQPSGSVTIAANDQAFDALISALSRPDQPKTDAVCPAYADLLQVVLVRTDASSYQVSIPTDGCGHYQ